MYNQQTLPLTVKTPGDAAALWWVAVLTNPKLDNGTAGDNPLMDILIDRIHHPVAEELAEFGGILARMINEQLEADDYIASEYGIPLAVDYHPNEILSRAADEAGLQLHMGQWPWKTHMLAKATAVVVSYGYRAEPAVIWTKSD